MIDAIVTGTSLPALQTALDLAEVGLSVAVLRGAEQGSSAPWSDRDTEGTIAAFLTRIAEPIEHAEGHRDPKAMPRHLAPEAVALRVDDMWQPLSEPSVFGVPAVPLSAESIAILGNGGAFRAYLDRVRPLLTVGKTRFYGPLVRSRVGVKALDRLVEPTIRERFGVSADAVEVAMVAPGLNEALSRHGALTSAVLAYADRNVARETRVTPTGSPAEFLGAALLRLAHYGVQLVDADLATARPEGSNWSVTLLSGETLEARALVVDFGENPVSPVELEPIVGAVAPSEARLYADFDIDERLCPDAGAAGIATECGWSLHVSGSQSPLESDAESGVHARAIAKSPVAQITELAQQLAEVSLLGAVAPLAAGGRSSLLEGASLRQARLVAAPYCSTEDRDEALAVLTELIEAQPTLLPVGRAVHGDDQSAAMGAAHDAAVQLRRRLLGLEE